MANDQKTAKIREALQQLDPTNNEHWTDDGLPREGAVREFAHDTTLSRRDIQAAWPGFQRAADSGDPLAGETVEKVTAKAPALADAAPFVKSVMAPPEGTGTGPATTRADDPGPNPTQNTGAEMSEAEVRDVLESRVRDAEQGLADAQQNVRDAHKGVETARANLNEAKDDLRREFPPLSQNANIKQFIASEQQRRAERVGAGRPAARIDLVMQRSNSRGWRRPARQGPAQTTGVNRGAHA